MSRRKRDRKGPSGAGAPTAAADSGREPGRFSARRKTETILRLLRGEALPSVKDQQPPVEQLAHLHAPRGVGVPARPARSCTQRAPRVTVLSLATRRL